MSLTSDLEAMREVISDPSVWVKNVGDATHYCAITSVDAVDDGMEMPRRREIWKALRNALPPGFEQVGDYNDTSTTTHADIMALFDRAIAASKA